MLSSMNLGSITVCDPTDHLYTSNYIVWPLGIFLINNIVFSMAFFEVSLQCLISFVFKSHGAPNKQNLSSPFL